MSDRKQDSSLTTVRLQLKASGYDPIPLKIDKKPYSGWPKEPNDPDSIILWGRYAGCVATGIRLYQSPSLFVLDLDIRTAAVRDAILQAYEQRWPHFMASCAPTFGRRVAGADRAQQHQQGHAQIKTLALQRR